MPYLSISSRPIERFVHAETSGAGRPGNINNRLSQPSGDARKTVIRSPSLSTEDLARMPTATTVPIQQTGLSELIQE